MGDAEQARKEGDTVGGIVECRIVGVPVGLGEPMFGKFSAELAHAMFSIPAVKGFEVWRAFDGKPATQFNTNQGESSYLKWYNPTAIKVTSINITNYANTSYAFGRVIVQGSNDDVSYTDIKEYTNSNNTKGDTWTISMSNNTNFYKYYKMLLLTSAQSSNTYRNCGDIKIYGKVKVEGSSNSIVFPLSFNNTNYNFNFGFQDSSGINIYILSKLKTGFSLSGSSSSTISWLACGY